MENTDFDFPDDYGYIKNTRAPDGGLWGYDNDYISQVQARKNIAENGHVIYIEPIPTEYDLAQKRMPFKMGDIENEYQSRVTERINYMNTVFDADEESQKMITRVIVAMGNATLPDFTWYDSFTVPIKMTKDQFQGLAQTILLRGQPLYRRMKLLKVKIYSSKTVAEVNAINWDTPVEEKATKPN